MENIYINLKENNNEIYRWLRKEFKKDLLSVEELIEATGELLATSRRLEEELENDYKYGNREPDDERDYYHEWLDMQLENGNI